MLLPSWQAATPTAIRSVSVCCLRTVVTPGEVSEDSAVPPKNEASTVFCVLVSTRAGEAFEVSVVVPHRTAMLMLMTAADGSGAAAKTGDGGCVGE